MDTEQKTEVGAAAWVGAGLEKPAETLGRVAVGLRYTYYQLY